ncbi:MAG: four helix bundle protein [Steroidobacteraceae bacterium]
MGAERRTSHKDLVLWQKSMDLAVETCRLARGFPSFEMYGLGAQLRRAAVSVPSNVAEGTARRTTREFISFLHIARGSLAELETQVFLARRLGYLDDTMALTVSPKIDEVGRLLNATIRGLQRRLDPPPSS